MSQANHNQLDCIEALQHAPAGLSLSVPAHRVRSCSTRKPAMNLARSDALHAAQNPTFPATHEIFEPTTFLGDGALQ